jgi:2'-5' RNA ligase
LFIAIELPQLIHEALGGLQARLKKLDSDQIVGWTGPNGIHLTLKFIGETDSARVEAIHAAMRVGCRDHQPFDLCANGIGAFPNSSQPRVVWVGLAGDLEALARLQTNIETAIVPLGYPSEDRPFSPHLTLGRVKRASGGEVRRLGEKLAHETVGQIGAWYVDRIALMCSDLKPTGAVYTQLAQIVMNQ